VQRQDLEHLLRASGDILNETHFYIIGSQSILGKFPDAPEELLWSAEADLIAKNKPKETDRLNEIGEDSPFHDLHGYYVDPVAESTAHLPKGWKGRLVNLTGPGTNGVIGLCLDAHDLFVSKVSAGRPKDIDYVKVMIKHQMVSMDRVLEYAEKVPVPPEDLTRKDRLIAKIKQLYLGVDLSKTKHINEASGRYTGKILSIAESACQQDIGKGSLVFHDLAKLDKPVSPGRVYTIEYKEGKGSVSEKIIERGRTR
jgi:hypothetical protein